MHPPWAANSLRPGFVNNVEGSFGGSAEASEARRRNHFSNLRFACLRAQAQPNFLRPRTRRTQQSREGVVHSADWIQVVFQLVVGEGLHNHPRPVFRKRLPDVLRRPNRIAHVMQAIEHGNEIVILARKFFGLGYFEVDSTGNSVTPRQLARSFNGLVVVIEPQKLRLREGLRQQER